MSSTTLASTLLPLQHSVSRAVDPGTFKRPSIVRLTRIELRKSIDTRSGRVLLLAVFALAAAALGWRLSNAENTPVAYEHFLGTAMIGVQAILPVIGVMALTSEWTQRTALTTFTTASRRGPVLAAKVVSALVLAAVATVIIMAATVLAALLAGTITGTDASFDGLWKVSLGFMLANLLNVLMAAAFGALIPQTAAAVTLFLVAPNLWSAAGPALLKDAAEWVNVYDVFGRFIELDFSHVPQTVTSLGVWIVLPLVVGVAASLRREVK